MAVYKKMQTQPVPLCRYDLFNIYDMDLNAYFISQWPEFFLGVFAKLQVTTSFIMTVCPSVCLSAHLHGTTQLHWTDYC